MSGREMIQPRLAGNASDVLYSSQRRRLYGKLGWDFWKLGKLKARTCDWRGRFMIPMRLEVGLAIQGHSKRYASLRFVAITSLLALLLQLWR